MNGRKGMVLAVLLAVILSGAFAQAAEPIKIGAIFSVTGPASFLGAPEAKTVEMLVDEINRKGGILGHKIELIVKDSGGSPEKAISFAKQLIEEDKVFAIIGPSTSGETMKIKGICEDGEDDPHLLRGGRGDRQPGRQVRLQDPAEGQLRGQKIFEEMKKMGITKIGVVSSNDGFGKARQGAAREARAGVRHRDRRQRGLRQEGHRPDRRLTKVKAADVQAVVNWSIVPAQSIVAKNMKQLGLNVPLFQSHGFGNIKYVEEAGEAAEGIIFPAGRLLVADELPDEPSPEDAAAEVQEGLRGASTRRTCSTFGGHAYDAFIILVEGHQEGRRRPTRKRSATRHREPQGLRRHRAASSTSRRRTTTASTSTPSRC